MLPTNHLDSVLTNHKKSKIDTKSTISDVKVNNIKRAVEVNKHWLGQRHTLQHLLGEIKYM